MLGSPLHLLPSFFDLLALGTILGALSIRLWVFPRAGRTEETVVFASIGGRFTSLLTWSLLLLTATSVAVLVVRAAEISGQPYGAVSRVLPAVLFKTHYGTIWFLRLAALFVLWAGVLAMRRTGGAAAPAAAFVAAAAIAWTYSATGHASDQGDFTIIQTMDWLHLLAISAWGGGLLAVTLVIRPALAEKMNEHQVKNLSGICRRLSRLAGCSLLVVIVTGSYGAWRHVPGLAALGDTIYGRALSVKLFFVLTMVLLGAINRYLVLPKLPASGGASATGGGQSGADLLRQFFRRVGQEAFLMILVLGCVTFLIHSPPPGPFMDMTRHHPAHIRDAEGP